MRFCFGRKNQLEQEAIQRNSTTKGIQLAIIGLSLTYMCLCSYSTGHAEGKDKQKRCGIGKGRN